MNLSKNKLLGVLMALPLVIFIYYPLVSKYGPIAIYLSIAIIALASLALKGVVIFCGWDDKEDSKGKNAEKITKCEKELQNLSVDLMHFSFEEIKTLEWNEVQESIEKARVTGEVDNRLSMIINFGKGLERLLPENSHDA
ncbi:hypothetical protein C4G52_RS22290 [Vibrio parahaemolyticus]|nr:hypothetical protein [Vibrio parahaemolyticus]